MAVTLTRLTVADRMVAFAVSGAELQSSPGDDFKSYVVTLGSGEVEYIKALSDDYALMLARKRHGSDVQVKSIQ